jgi:CheY-like chemotaxis protein
MENTDMPSRLNVLLIDDDHSDLALLGLAIEQSDREIWLQTANDVQRAVDYLRGRDTYEDRLLHPLPDLVVLDLDMQLSAGFEFLDWWRASQEFSLLPVILISGWAYAGAVQAALAMGAAVWWPKPGQLQDWSLLVEKLWCFLPQMTKVPAPHPA